MSDLIAKQLRANRASKPMPQTQEHIQPPATRGGGFIDFCGSTTVGWVVCGWISADWDHRIGTPNAELRLGDETCGCRGLMALYKRPDVENVGGRGFVMLLADEFRAGADLTRLTIHNQRGSFILTPSIGIEYMIDGPLRERARNVLANSVVTGSRDRMLGILSRSEYYGDETINQLKWPVYLEIDETFFAPPSGLVLRGWFLDPFSTVETIRVRGADVSQTLHPEDWVPIRRPDVTEDAGVRHGAPIAACGFLAYAPGVFAHGETIYIEIETRNGELAYKNVPRPQRQGLASIEAILTEIHLRYGELSRGFDNVIGPAITSINSARIADRPRVQRVQFGYEIDAPRCSVIVPLHGRIDFMEYQLAFAPSSWGTTDEIIYVLDDPRRTHDLESLARSCFERFSIPFTLLLFDRNMGYAPANNIGVEQARGQQVCFLNSDVVPKEPRWLDFMLQTLASDSRIGIVGAQLLFEDGSVQHEGGEFIPQPEFANWRFFIHTNKGRRPAPDTSIQSAAAVTAACMVMRRDLLQRLGGFDESYVIGDFEDTDLCLRVHAEGLTCVVDRRATLYHLERQSQNEAKNSWRMNLTLFNAWQHQKRWFGAVEGDEI
jgi:O-antigen biosynthesis protein